MIVSKEQLKTAMRSKAGIGGLIIAVALIAGGVVMFSGSSAPAKTQTFKIDSAQTKTSVLAATDSTGNTPATPTTTKTTPATTKSTTSTSSGSSSSSNGGSSGSGTTKLVQKLPPATFVANFAGSWYTNFGVMTLTQSGGKVTGTFSNSPNNTSGTIAATVSASTLSGTWTINSLTKGPLVLVKGTHTFSGSYNSVFKWCGALKGYQYPAGCGFDGHWVTNVLSNGNNCAMDLIRINDSVTGTYCNGTITGTISYPIGNTKLSGDWHIGTVSGPYSFFLAALNVSSQQLFFQGNYNIGSVVSNYWCGGTTIANQPAACIKT